MKVVDLMRAGTAALLLSVTMASATPAAATEAAAAQNATTHDPRDSDTFSPEEIVKAGSDFFGVTTEAMAKAVERVFSKYGRPNAYIAGSDGGGACVVGLR